MYNIHIQDSVQVIELTLRMNGRLRSWDYLKDHTFEAYVLRDNINSPDEALAFADHLEQQCKTTCPGVCSKARTIRSYLNGDGFWSKNQRYLGAMAYARRVHCWGHEAGSFYLRQNSGHPTWGQTIFPPLKELIVPDFTYNEDQIILIIDNTHTLLACVLEITEQKPQILRQFFESGQAVDVVPYRDQVTKDALRREMATLLHFDEDRQAQFWQDATIHYQEKLAEGVDCRWALPTNVDGDKWEVPAN